MGPENLKKTVYFCCLNTNVLYFLGMRMPVAYSIGFSQIHKVGNAGINANFVFTYFQFPSLYASYGVSKCEIRHQWLSKEYISKLES